MKKYLLFSLVLLCTQYSKGQDFYNDKFSAGPNNGWYKVATFDLNGNSGCCNSVNVDFAVHYVNPDYYFDIEGNIRFRQHKPGKDVAEWSYRQTNRSGEFFKFKKLGSYIYELWGYSPINYGHFSVELAVTKENGFLLVTTYNSPLPVTDGGELDVNLKGDYYFPHGNVGIGTTTPGTRLQVDRTSPATSFEANVFLKGKETTGAAETGGALAFYGNDGNNDRGWAYIRGLKENSTVGNTASYLSLGTRTGNGSIIDERMRITSTGNVGIGTTSPDAKLTVKGTIHTQEVKVDLNGAVAPDYVFADGYKLPELRETEAYIQANKHLPGIPSAAEMEEEGINLKEMNLKLLEKVEELTLYLIEMKNENEVQKELNKKQQEQLEALLGKSGR